MLTDSPEKQADARASESSTTSRIDLLQESAYDLAIQLKGARPQAAPANIPIRRLDSIEKQISNAYDYFRKASIDELVLSYSSEWILDNYYILRQAILQIKENLPGDFYGRLPRLHTPPFSGRTRVYVLARAIVARNNLKIDLTDVEQFLRFFQQETPITTGELWAFPLFLRYVILEALAQALLEITHQEPDHKDGFQSLSIDLDPDEIVASSVIALRQLSNQDWKKFFEDVSRVNQTLLEDPAGVYGQMEFKTRDLYRKVVEDLAFRSGVEENEVARQAIALAAAVDQAAPAGDRHVGHFLIAAGRKELENAIGFHPSASFRFRSWLREHPSLVYIGSIVLLTTVILLVISLLVLRAAHSPFETALSVLIGFIPSLTISASLVNWFATALVPPEILPKIKFEKEIPETARTLVVVPAMLTSLEEADSLVRQIEMHYLRNPEPGISFGLLTDFNDASQQTMPTDNRLVEHTIQAINRLNQNYSRDGRCIFYFFHRRRLWNPSEGVWMGWERKRGKLHELNRLLRGSTQTSFANVVGDESVFPNIRFIITLDADTILPSSAARRLIGTMAHPLNQVRYSSDGKTVISGYTVLQPRVEISPSSSSASSFARVFSGDTGLDLYTLAVSDVYQDLFAEGIFVGKGIYDLDAFERSVNTHIPENTLLSHDLLEGLLGRAGLVSDITLVEDYPSHYLIYARRHERWIRGDWQLLPWLFTPKQVGVSFSAIDRWKIIDNLRRSLLAPALLLVFLFGWVIFPRLSAVMTIFGLSTLAIPVFTGLVQGIASSVKDGNVTGRFRSARLAIWRWLTAVVFLPFEAWNAIQAIFITLYRMLISHKHLLQWTTSAHASRVFHRQNSDTSKSSALKMVPSLFIPVAFLILIIVSRSPAFFTAIPLIAAWVLSPLIADRFSRRTHERAADLTIEQIRFLRMIARRTWSFFEHFVGPEDHWLPPDHFQESPLGVVAHRTSPTNIGLLLTSTLAAYDLGYLDQFSLITRLSTTMDTLSQLERYRGHLLNWYDTRTLQPLPQRYVSTVDSGNLAACLIILSQACRKMPTVTIFRSERWSGYLDTLAMLESAVSELSREEKNPIVERMIARVHQIRDEVEAVRTDTSRWYPLFQTILEDFWQEIIRLLGELIETSGETLKPEALRGLLQVSRQVESHHDGISRSLRELVPWVAHLRTAPDLLTTLTGPSGDEWNRLTNLLQVIPKMNQLGDISRQGYEIIAGLREDLRKMKDGDPKRDEALAWLDELARKLETAASNIGALLSGYARLAQLADQFVEEMDFTFLYDRSRRIFHLGYNLDIASLDANYYDLLASEARIASIIAIAKHEVPQQHWLHLSRPVTQVEKDRVLLSWSGTMFEYLMPPLFLHSFEGTLLHQSSRGAVELQSAYGHLRGVPWGISESGYYRLDNNQNYQYRAFGVPGLGFKRGLGDDLVVAPYASMMALPIDPLRVYQNAVHLNKIGMLGLYGFYESIDYTADRLRLGEQFAIIRSFMSHHQGMTMMALVNWAHNDIMVERMHSSPMIKSVELLLQEQIPYSAPLEDPLNQDVMGNERLSVSQKEIIPWNVPIHTPIPITHLLSNGKLNSILSNSSSGYLQWADTALTRWIPDAVRDPSGIWIYIQDLQVNPQEGGVWSVGNQPVPEDGADILVTHAPHMSTFRRVHNDIAVTMEVTIHPDDDVEIRRMMVSNLSARPRKIRIASYGEVILSSLEADARHPAFNKLFIESDFIQDLNTLVFWRRPRSAKEEPIFLGHLLMVEKGRQPVAYETNRANFLGRGLSSRIPAALMSSVWTGQTGATLDPIFSLATELDLKPHENRQLAFLTLASGSRDGLMAIANRYQDWDLMNRAFDRAALSAQASMRKRELSSQTIECFDRLLSALLYPLSDFRAPVETIAANRMGQSGLWPHGISGDFPILLVKIQAPQDLDLVREAIQAHQFWRNRRVKIDLVILNEQSTNYGAELNNLLYRLISRTNSEGWLNQRGGIFILFSSHVKPEELTLLETAARVVLQGEKGALADQIPPYSIPVAHLPAFTPSRLPSEPIEGTPSLPDLPDLRFDSGAGEDPNPHSLPAAAGFSPDGREYVIHLNPDQCTPAPWVNVIGYPDFGFMVTESGSSVTWSVNSGENRLTPWWNDPVTDPTGEALYLRDEETGEFWTPTLLPAGKDGPHRVRHGFGYTIFEHNSHGLIQELKLFASPSDPIKIVQLTVTNTWNRQRRITATQYVEWVLGVLRSTTSQFLLPEYSQEPQALLVTNPYNPEFGERVAFLATDRPVHGFTTDRAEFIGRGRDLSNPVSFSRIGLESRLRAGEDSCAALQIHLDLNPGETQQVAFFFGQAANRQQVASLVQAYKSPGQVEKTWQSVGIFWNKLLCKLQVSTPDPAMDILLNGWLLYQTLSCRIWGRTAFYQSSGAFGFRDQLQDVMALLPIEPGITRAHILESSRHQFDAGDVLHWWHPPSGRGIRTRFSDDLLWLPYVLSEYVRTTGDRSILTEKTPFLTGDPLKPDEDERYGQYGQTAVTYSLLEHCLRAIDRGTTSGPHQLPLIGTGDWNDGMNRVGADGRGESIWLAWFLYDILDRFTGTLAEPLGAESVSRITHQKQALAQSIEQAAWDGQWYLRAFYDSGVALGSSRNLECQIDSIAQSWAVLSGAAHPDRAHLAMQSVLDRLVHHEDRLILLFTPPFDRTQRDPGYIKGYVPGIRENGGQYTHASTWVVWAFTKMGQGTTGMDLFRLLNPIYQALDPQRTAIYKVEPYVIAADVYSTPPHVRRGGWTWYTGSSGWYYRLGIEAILGLRRRSDSLQIDPVIPSHWNGYQMNYRIDSSVYHIQVENPNHVEHGVIELWLDGERLEGSSVPLKNTNPEYTLRVVMGHSDSTHAEIKS
jgi:cyclic beta-1,2-glucan synthetase